VAVYSVGVSDVRICFQLLFMLSELGSNVVYVLFVKWVDSVQDVPAGEGFARWLHLGALVDVPLGEVNLTHIVRKVNMVEHHLI